MPTGGGKTVLAAHAIGVAARELLQAPNPMVLWLVPSTPILDQTVAALKMLDHPYRPALAGDFGRNVSILTKAEALAMSRADAEGGACIIVSTIQSFRREKPNGEADEESLKVCQDAGVLMEHFQHLTEAQQADLDRIDGTAQPVRSLANLLRLHPPMVIVDEAHNARTALLQMPQQKFYPDFVAMLRDGRVLVVEYKGGHLYEAEKVKRQIGDVWATRPGARGSSACPRIGAST